MNTIRPTHQPAGRRHLRASAWLIAALAVFPGACANRPSHADVSAKIDEIAGEYVDGYYHQFPEEAYEAGYPDAPTDRFGDRSPAALTDWYAHTDRWLAELRAIDPTDTDHAAQIVYQYARWHLEASKALRVCRSNLWNVSPTYNGWQSILPSTLAVQPVGTAAARADALARLKDIPRYLRTEIQNLKTGLSEGFSAPRSNVDAVIVQMNSILDGAVEDSPFYDPAIRSGDPGFRKAVHDIIADEIMPAVRVYRDYLHDTYRPAARVQVGVSANPDGDACYHASVYFYTSLPLSPEEIHQNGLQQMARTLDEVRTIGRASFGTDDPRAVFDLVTTDPKYRLYTPEEILAFSQQAIDRARSAVPGWFGFVPHGKVIIKPDPAFKKSCGGGFYSAGAADGSRPGTYELGTDCPDGLARADLESTAFHETYPGHHLQVSVGLERGKLHPILRYFFFSGTGEGWALYTEQLADEMGLYSSDVDRIGMLSNRALRAARLVVDPGMHELGWSRERSIDYLVHNTAMSRAAATVEIDRYIAMPAQATSYMVGCNEILRLRKNAEEALGKDFDIKAFHDLVISDGTVTLGMLRSKVHAWIEAGR